MRRSMQDGLQFRLKNAFAGPIAPVPATPRYRLSQAAAAVTMVLMQAAYAALVIGLAWGWVALIVYVLPYVRNLWVWLATLVTGPVVLLALIKPLLARQAKPMPPVSLDREKEPYIFAFVEALCHVVSAPVPSRIDVMVGVNASAGYRRGLLSIPSRDLVLTIGLPLAAAFDLRKFTAVLAHEFGHFSQGAGMGFFYLTRRIQLWFARVVHERDEWDRWLDDWSEYRPIALARLVVIGTRKLLNLLMLGGGYVASLLSRQMEFDADRYAARVCGSRALREMFEGLAVLDAAAYSANWDLERTWREGKLGDNFPQLIVANLAQLPQETQRNAVAAAMKATVGMYADHPSMADRIHRAEAAAESGVFDLDMPAADLFRDFEGVCRAASMAFYRENLGQELAADLLISTTEVLTRSRALRAIHEARGRYFGRVFDGPYWLTLDRAPLADPAAELRAAAAEWQAGHGRIMSSFDALAAARERRDVLKQAHCFVQSGLRIKSGDFGLPDGASSTVSEALGQAERDVKASAAEFVAAAPIARRRVNAMLQLDADPAAHAAAARLDAISASNAQFDVLTDEYRDLIGLLQNFGAHETNERFRDSFDAQVKAAKRALGNFSLALERADAKVAREVFRRDGPIGGSNALAILLDSAGLAFQRRNDIYAQSLGAIAEAGERTEKHISEIS